jgi:thioredoxin 1
MSVIELNSNNFKREAVSGGMPMVVDFWAEWCGPCQMMSPIFEKLEKEMGNRIKFGKVNVDEERRLASKYGVQGIPCLIVIENGKEVGRVVGLMLKEELKNKLLEILNEKN